MKRDLYSMYRRDNNKNNACKYYNENTNSNKSKYQIKKLPNNLNQDEKDLLEKSKELYTKIREINSVVNELKTGNRNGTETHLINNTKFRDSNYNETQPRKVVLMQTPNEYKEGQNSSLKTSASYQKFSSSQNTPLKTKNSISARNKDWLAMKNNKISKDRIIRNRQELSKCRPHPFTLREKCPW